MSDPFQFGRNRAGQLDRMQLGEAYYGIKCIPQNSGNRLANPNKFKRIKNEEDNSESLGIDSNTSQSQERHHSSPKKQVAKRNRPRKLDFGS